MLRPPDRDFGQPPRSCDADAARAVQDILSDAVLRYGPRPAIDFFGRRWTYTQLDTLATRAAAGLQALGVAPGDRVGLCLPNTPYFIIFYFAILKAGAVVVNYNPLYVARELCHQIRDSGTRVMVTIDIVEIHAKVTAAGASSGPVANDRSMPARRGPCPSRKPLSTV